MDGCHRYKQYNTPASLAELTEIKLKAAGVSEKEDRKVVLSAIRKAGYKPTASPARKGTGVHDTPTNVGSVVPSTSRSQAAMSSPKRYVNTPPCMSDLETVLLQVAPLIQPNSPADASRRKRKRVEDRNEFVPDRPDDELEGRSVGSLEFNEVLDEEVLRSKFVVVNRAPIMMAWSFVVAERLGFQREEALSIASVYTEMNAISKGVAIGLYDEAKRNGVEANKGGAQPYVDLMGRRYVLLPLLHVPIRPVNVDLRLPIPHPLTNTECTPLYQTAAESWHALSAGTPVAPGAAFSYITRALRQTAPFVIGALRLLALSLSPADLNRRGFYLYADFRPDTNEWGGRGEVRCATILDLRRKEPPPRDGVAVKTEDIVKIEADSSTRLAQGKDEEDSEPAAKKSRGMSLEEYEAALDVDDWFANVDLDTLGREPTTKTEPHD
ncbi:hypothetical protein PHLGIDRAFT_100851 [Phlebiopsis gigantea 11061_1 CR5-6]|uniref:Uncharacterized protein n=1 Tax=Phlebiopsis gigantea (strain 11061_1 CR5-6) TaxID=745531 RepID=A0A0C3S4K1_PHLG1|nr:hypothetical protein PHLGIDRAFT_100851 [Phlebiopsis gigantea 11061_1 CR5-6]